MTNRSHSGRSKWHACAAKKSQPLIAHCIASTRGVVGNAAAMWCSNVSEVPGACKQVSTHRLEGSARQTDLQEYYNVGRWVSPPTPCSPLSRAAATWMRRVLVSTEPSQLSGNAHRGQSLNAHNTQLLAASLRHTPCVPVRQYVSMSHNATTEQGRLDKAVQSVAAARTSRLESRRSEV